MITTIHQPEAGLYLGLISKILQSNIFIILNTAQFKKNYWGNRIAIRTKNGSQILTIPVEKHNHKPYNQVKIIYPNNWQESFLKSISQNYSKATYFENYFPILKEIIQKKYDNLAQLNIILLNWILKIFDYQGEIFYSSHMNLDPNLKSTELLLEINKNLNSDSYLSGKSGQDYLDLKLFKKANIDVNFQKFFHPVYQQIYPEFIPYLSSLDLIFNYGEQAKEILYCKGAEALRTILKNYDYSNKRILELFAGDGTGESRIYKDIEWDGCEIDYYKYLKCKKLHPKANIYNMDMFKFLNICLKKYDIIVIDAPAPMQIEPILPYIERLIDNKGIIILRAVKMLWDKDLALKPTLSIEECGGILGKTIKIDRLYEKPREYMDGKLWLSNYIFEVSKR